MKIKMTYCIVFRKDLFKRNKGYGQGSVACFRFLSKELLLVHAGIFAMEFLVKIEILQNLVVTKVL